MKISFLGTGNAFAPQRCWSSMLINDTILFDAGPSVLAGLKRLPANTADIRQIFISHFHGDHCFGLPFLLLDYLFLAKTDAPLAIIGPPGIEAHVQAMMALAYPDIHLNGWPRPTTFVEAQPGDAQVVDGLTFVTVEMAHGSSAITSFGYRLYLPDAPLAYSGDTRYTDALLALIDGARAIIVEADSADNSPVHLGRQSLRALLAHIPASAVTFITHLDVPGAEPWADIDVIVPRDLQTFELLFPPGELPEVLS